MCDQWHLITNKECDDDTREYSFCVLYIVLSCLRRFTWTLYSSYDYRLYCLSLIYVSMYVCIYETWLVFDDKFSVCCDSISSLKTYQSENGVRK